MDFSVHSVACGLKTGTCKCRQFNTESMKLCEVILVKVHFKGQTSGERPHDPWSFCCMICFFGG